MDEEVKIVTEAVMEWCEWDIGRMGLGADAEAKVAEMVRCIAWTLGQDADARKAFGRVESLSRRPS